MLKNILLLLFIIFSSSLFSQNHIIGATTGGSNSSIVDLVGIDGRKAKSGGISYEYMINKNFYIGTELCYDPLGYILNLMHRDENGFLKAVDRYGIQYNYLSLPLSLGYRTNGKMYGFTRIGVVPSVLLYEDFVLLNTNIRLGELVGYTGNGSVYLLSGMVDVGLAYQIVNRLHFFSVARFQRSFTSILEDSGKSRYNQSVSLIFGVKWALRP